jgi:hypothetical protein
MDGRSATPVVLRDFPDGETVLEGYPSTVSWMRVS